ncbi:MAG: DUF748 domain-containing protein, partial [Endomicrobiales bacterium]
MAILKKILTILFLFTAMLSLIALAAVCAFKVAFPDEKLRKMLVDGGRGYLQRDVALEKFSWGVFSGVEMAGLAVSEPGGFHDGGTFVSGRRITFTVELLPLLKRTLRVGTLSLESPKLRLVRYKDGSFNFSELSRAFSGHHREALSAFRAAAPLPFFIGEVSVTDGALEFSQAPRGPSLLL